ncbi:MAG: helicase C-terminal domain-containing protein [Patescibacteria group bacterium]|mgnify:CR=1 FL=1
MVKTVVGIDIETTALDPKAGEIIEVAAIRFDLEEGRELNRFEVLCRPSRPITLETTAITGITGAMVEGMAPFSEHIEQVQKFVGEDTLFAHNAPFDLSWLHTHGCRLPQPVWDTFPLAAVTWPEADSYNLGTLAKDLGITVTGEHRAGADIVLTWKLLQKIRENLKISASLKEKVKHILQGSGQLHYLPLFTPGGYEMPEKIVRKPKIAGKPDAKEVSVASVLGPGGKLEKSLAGFTARAEQVRLSEYISESIAKKTSAIIEAPSGIGKTFAYLASALQSSGRTLISTHTRVLQDQLVEKDIPALLASLGVERSVATLKGRRNYVCGTRLRKLLEGKRFSPSEAWILLKVLLWLERGGSGDIERLNLSHQPPWLIQALTANTAACTRRCENCPYQRSREAAQSADITVVNHALLLHASPGEDRLGSDYSLLIVDEGHQLEDAATAASEVVLSAGVLAELLKTLRSFVGHEKISEETTSLLKQFDLLQDRGALLLHSHGGEETRLRLSPTLRRSRLFHELKESGVNCLSRISFLLGLARSQEKSVKKEEMTLYREAIRQIEKFRLELEDIVNPKSRERVQWIEQDPASEEVSFHDAALSIAPYTTECLGMIQPTILISATLSTETGFDYIKERFGIFDWPTVEFESPYDFRDQMRIFVVEDGPLAGSSGFDQFVAQVIGKVGAVTRGRLLALFTSQASVGAVHEMLTSILNRGKTRLLSQKISGGRHNIARRFRDEHSSILLGTHSFWDGFDSPGETLSVLVIPKLPFSQPTDPIIEGLSEQAGTNSFEKVMLPRMTLRLKQGVGRLIRATTDRGVVILLDKRLLEKKYGRGVLHALPPAPVEVVAEHELPQKIEEHFGPETITRWQKTL